MAKSEDPDEMPYMAAFHFAQIQVIFREGNALFYRNVGLQSLEIQNGQFHNYFINKQGKINLKKGLVNVILSNYYLLSVEFLN